MSPSPVSHPPESSAPQDEPLFQSPWEARAFAIVNQLSADNYYSWTEWTHYLVNEISALEQVSPGEKTYYEQWLNACEKILIDKGLLTPEAIQHKIAELLSERETEHKH
jgi:nitrile hydratase accessory protein